MSYPAFLGELEVEVKGNNGAYYKAFVLDITDTAVLVGFQDNWQSPRQIPLSDARMTESRSALPFAVDPGTVVEVFSRAKESEPCGWWKAEIKQCKGEFFIIEYVGWDAVVSEIVERNRLRVPNRQPPLTAQSFYKCVIEVPDNVRYACEDLHLHVDLLRACHANTIVGNCKQGTLTLLSQSEDTIRRAQVLADMHVRNLHTKVLLKARSSEANGQKTAAGLSRSSEREHLPSDGHVETFFVDSQLMGLAIGARGSNIQACRDMPGIRSIEVDEKRCAFRVCGDSPEAVSEARRRLEFKCEAVLVPQAYTGRVIGRHGAKIQEIISTSQVFRVQIDNEKARKEVPFYFIGRKEAVENAKVLVEYLLENVKELEQLTNSAGYRQRGTIAGAVFTRETPAEMFAVAAESMDRDLSFERDEEILPVGHSEYVNPRFRHPSSVRNSDNDERSSHVQGQQRSRENTRQTYNSPQRAGRQDRGWQIEARGRRSSENGADVAEQRRRRHFSQGLDQREDLRGSEQKSWRRGRGGRNNGRGGHDYHGSRNTDWEKHDSDRQQSHSLGNNGRTSRARGGRSQQTKAPRDRDAKDRTSNSSPTDRSVTLDAEAATSRHREEKGTWKDNESSAKKSTDRTSNVKPNQSPQRSSSKSTEERTVVDGLAQAAEKLLINQSGHTDDSGVADVSA